jgi:hypothetical protein
MTVPAVVFDNNDGVAHAVLQHVSKLRPSPQRFTLRPYQYQAPKFTEWWLVPSTEWPAYRFSKLCFHQYRPAPEYLHTGFYIEKGLGSEVAGLPDVKPKHVIHPNWYWYKFLARAESGESETPFREVLGRSGCSITVAVDVYEFNRVPETAEERQRPDDMIEYIIGSAGSANRRFEPIVEGAKVLSALNECTDLCDLACRLRDMPDLNWYWINLVIGIKLRYGDESIGTWGAGEIWHNALEPWLDWVH